MTLPPYPRSSPPPEVKPIVDDRLASPTAAHAYGSHHQQGGGIASGAPVPASAAAAAEAAQRDREEKGVDTRVKRVREWEEDDGVSVKKPASEDARARLDEIHRHSPRPGARLGSPDRRSSSERPRNDDYHQAPPPQHQHQTLPSINSNIPTNHQLAPISDSSRHEPPRRPDEDRDRKEVIEPAARKVEVDEDYDDDVDEDLKRSGQNGHPSSASQEKKTSPGGSNASNGVSVGQANEQ